MPNENLGRRAHKNESGLLLFCSDWREVSDRFSWDIAEALCIGDRNGLFESRNLAVVRVLK